MISISDTGPGLPKQERAVLKSGEETSLVHGNGLGLWLVHWIIESINGELKIQEQDRGTCIEISLRRAAEQHE